MIVIADEVDGILIEDLPIVRGKDRIGERKAAVVVIVTEVETRAVLVRGDVVVSIALDILRGHNLSGCKKMLVDKG